MLGETAVVARARENAQRISEAASRLEQNMARVQEEVLLTLTTLGRAED